MASTSDSYDSENIFAKIIDGKIPSYKVYEDDNVLAILDAFPVVPGHTLILPKQKGPFQSLLDMDADSASKFMSIIPKIANAVKKATDADAINIVSNLGKEAGQMVFHPHIHIIPRFGSEGEVKVVKMGPSSKEMVSKEEGLGMVDKIKGALA